MQSFETVWELTIYLAPIVALLACVTLFVRTRKLGFVILAIVQLAYLLPLVLHHFTPNAVFGVLFNVLEMGGWVLLVAGFLMGRSRNVSAAAGAAASATSPAPACAKCNAPLALADRFCVKCGHATGT
jgi:hypothetical protein